VLVARGFVSLARKNRKLENIMILRTERKKKRGGINYVVTDVMLSCTKRTYYFAEMNLKI